jgi:multidrug efflux system outer membrane protein
VPEGRLVGKDGPTHMATIDKIDRMYVVFTLADRDALVLRRAAEAGLITAGVDAGNVRVFLPNGRQYTRGGKLDFTDLQVNPDTGTITLRGVLPNPERELLPGMFVRVLLDVGQRPNSVLVPQAAVVKTPTGHIAWVVTKDNKVERRDLVMGPWHKEDWRVDLARAQYGVQRSEMFPTLAANAAATRSRLPSAAGGGANVVTESSTLGLAVPSWEIDLWGRLASLSESARRSYLASEQNARAVQVSLVAEVALAYIQLVGLDEQVAISVRTLESRRKSLAIVTSRFRAGITSVLDVRQAEILVAGAQATLAQLQLQRSQVENALSILVGSNPRTIVRADTLSPYDLPAELPAGMPAALVDRRPDLLAAEENLRAADLNVDAARKAFLPAISITGFLGYASPAMRALTSGDNYAWSVEPAIKLPIFTWGRLASSLEATEAQQRIALEQYRAAIRNAFREVDNALAAYQSQREQREALAASAKANRERLRLTELRYVNGVASYFEVLDSQRNLFEAELDYVQATQSTYAAVVQLYRALGGGWSDK